MADHRIERVDRFISHRAGCASGRQPKQRSDNSVAGAFGQRLNHRARDFGFVKTGGIAACNDARQPPPR